jgi:hypothetical protein
MGVVYKGTDPDTGEAVAVKVLPVQLAADPMFVNRFRREMLTLQRLKHPGVVRILDQGEGEAGYYYVMEYMDGGSLEGKFKEGKLDPLAATRTVLSVSRVLEHLHSEGVIHRDLKPANVMLTRDGQPKLTDFGIAKLVDATRMTGTVSVLGTVEYMSPEQSQGRFVDPRTDIYSLGVIYYRALTGRLPITGTTLTEVMMNLRTHQVERPTEWVPELPEYVSDLVMRMLHKDPAKRIPSAKALTRELERVEQRLIEEEEGNKAEVSAEPVGWVRPGRREEPRAPVYRNPWVIAAGVLVAALAVCVYFATRTPKAEKRMQAAQAFLAQGTDEGNDRAMEELEALLSEHPESPLVPEAKEMLGALQAKQQTTSMARQLNFLGRLILRRGNLELARDLFKLVTVHFPNTEEAAVAAGKVAEIEHRLSHPDKPVPGAAGKPVEK